MSFAALVSEIDARRDPHVPLASALRVVALAAAASAEPYSIGT